METYSNLCIEWLLEKDTERLSNRVNTLCKSKVDISHMSTQDVASVILQSRTGESKKIVGQKSTLKCLKCMTETVEYVETQTRGADEGASIRYTCTKCLHLWIHK